MLLEYDQFVALILEKDERYVKIYVHIFLT